MPKGIPKSGHRRRRGGQPGNANAVQHGYYRAAKIESIGDILADMQRKQELLSGFVEKAMTEENTEDILRLLQLYGQNASRLGRLLRDQRALSGEAVNGLAEAFAKALDELSTTWGVEL